jgi:hypothetical protein
MNKYEVDYYTCYHSLFLLPTGAMQLNISAFNMEDVFSVSVNTIKGNADAKKISIGDIIPPLSAAADSLHVLSAVVLMCTGRDDDISASC